VIVYSKLKAGPDSLRDDLRQASPGSRHSPEKNVRNRITAGDALVPPSEAGCQSFRRTSLSPVERIPYAPVVTVALELLVVVTMLVAAAGVPLASVPLFTRRTGKSDVIPQDPSGRMTEGGE